VYRSAGTRVAALSPILSQSLVTSPTCKDHETPGSRGPRCCGRHRAKQRDTPWVLVRTHSTLNSCKHDQDHGRHMLMLPAREIQNIRFADATLPVVPRRGDDHIATLIARHSSAHCRRDKRLAGRAFKARRRPSHHCSRQGSHHSRASRRQAAPPCRRRRT